MSACGSTPTARTSAQVNLGASVRRSFDSTTGHSRSSNIGIEAPQLEVPRRRRVMVDVLAETMIDLLLKRRAEASR
jgi:hypothetical protein